MDAASEHTQPIFLRVEELATRWRTEPQSIRRWLKRGKIPSIRPPGRKYRLIPLVEVERIEQARSA
ncbi:MAG: helix-turn-helix domain-containing protein [Verrucomicrobiales bacterium]